MSEMIAYGGRNVPLLGSYDAVIVGAGSAGCAAAYTCAGHGVRTLLVEKSIRTGGSSVNALVTPMMDSYTGHHSVFYDLEAALNKRAQTRDQFGTLQRNYSADNMADAWEELLQKAGCEILYDACLSDVIIENGKIRTLIVTTCEGLQAINGKVFADTTGDAVFLREAGVPTSHGDDQGNDQLSSLRFEMGGIDIEALRSYVMGLHDKYSRNNIKGDLFESAMVGGRGFSMEPLFRKGVEEGILTEDELRYYQNYSIPGKPGCMSFNCPHLVNLKSNASAMDRSRAVQDGHASIQRLVKFLKKYMPGFENSYLIREADMIGIRESWRLNGIYVLTSKDYIKQARFEDGIARGDWWIDVHTADGKEQEGFEFKHGDYYEIPYRSLVCKDIRNIICAGRCISTDFLMQASIRIIPTCIDMGQAAGEALALSVKDGIELNVIDGKNIRERLGEYR